MEPCTIVLSVSVDRRVSETGRMDPGWEWASADLLPVITQLQIDVNCDELFIYMSYLEVSWNSFLCGVIMNEFWLFF